MFVDQHESEDRALLRSTVASLAREFGYPYFSQISRSDANPTELWRALGSAGLLGVNIPERFGGGGGDMADLVVVTEEVAASGCPLMLLALSPAVCATVLVRHGTDEQRAEWLPGLADGGSIMAFAITEPEAGSNTRRIETRAQRDGDDWVITGTKHYVSHVDNCDAMLVVARTGTDEVSGNGQLSLFIVDSDAQGLHRDVIPVDIVSPDRQFTLSFDRVRVPGERLVGEVGGAMRAIFSGLNPERLGSAAVVNGISRYVLERAVDYARTRSVFGQPIGAHQAVAHPLARAWMYVTQARASTMLAADRYDAGTAGPEAANVAKYLATDAASLALDAAVQTHGGNGVAVEYGIGAMSGLVRLFRIAPVTSEMILNHTAHSVLGLPRSY
jgi:alkylation response protein AidB-like acyl-CoA dehydrogenase